MVPDQTEAFQQDKLIITEVSSHGWTAVCGAYRLSVTLPPRTSSGYCIGDCVGWVSDGRIWFKEESIIVTGYLAAITRPTGHADPKPPPKEKPYLALNQAPWQKRKKGRHP